MEISAEKTKLMTSNTSGINTEIKVNGQKLETVTSFNYLGSVVTDKGLPFIMSSQNHLARHSEGGKEDKADRRKIGKTLGNGQAWSHQVPESSGEQKQMEETVCEIICGAQTTLAVEGLMMMMMR